MSVPLHTGPGTARAARTVPVVVAVVFALLATIQGLSVGWRHMDVDEAAFRDAVRSMRTGEGYYPAMRDALEEKEGRPPRSVRAVRPPTTYLFLRLFPEWTWRWLAGALFLAILLAVGRLAAPSGTVSAALATVVGGLWCLGFTNYLVLHAELWGVLPMLLGLLAIRRGDDRAGAAWMVLATATRELFGLGLVIGLLTARRRRPWVVGLGAVVVLAVVHALLAGAVLDPNGFEAAFGNEVRTATFLLRVVSPGSDPASYAIGAVTVVAGLAGAWRHRHRDRAAVAALLFVAVMVPLSILVTRVYWSATWAPVAAAFVPAAVASAVRNDRDPPQEPAVAAGSVGASPG